MESTPYIWQDGKITPWAEATTHVLSHGLHYGSGVFEGIRFYQTDAGPAIFRLKEHMERFIYSAKAIGMIVPYSVDALCDAIENLVAMNGIQCGYIRPLAFFGYGSMRVVPDASLPINVVIACWPWGDYLPAKAIDVQISDYIRIHPKSTVADAKICGHYVNSIMAGLAIAGTGYHEALLLDIDGFVAEGSAENIFIVKNGEIYTTETGTILEGITRNTIMEIAKHLGYKVHECRFKPEEVIQADEAFFCGTAVEVTAIGTLDDQKIADGKIGKITQQIQQYYLNVVHGRTDAFKHYVTIVKPKEISYAK